MLIPVSEWIPLCSKIRGVIHIGAHDCEEQKFYNEVGADKSKVIWIEAMQEKIDLFSQQGYRIFQSVISDTDNEEIKFKITNNEESSSILELGTHSGSYPDIKVIREVTLNTTRMDTFISREKLDIDVFNFLNIDIQGAELKALKGFGNLLEKIDHIYLEVNTDYVYKNCALLPEIDEYLGRFGFIRVIVKMTGANWGDAFYVRKSRLSVTAHLQGGLGNQLFQIAVASCYAWNNNISSEFELDKFSRHGTLLKFSNTIFSKIPKISGNYSYVDYIEPRILKEIPAHHGRNIRLKGWFQSYKFLPDKFSGKLRELFSFPNDLLEQETVAIHVRRGDYETVFPEHPRCKLSYYEQAISLFPKDSNFIVFSDDISWCKEQLLFKGMKFCTDLTDVEELYLMSRCHHFIIANSTFSWWAAFMSKNESKRVIYPENWILGERDRKLLWNISPENWIRLSNNKVKTYIINLEKHELRRNLISSQLHQCNNFLNWQITKAVDGTNTSIGFSTDKNWVDPILNTPIRVGEIGCSLSHWNCWVDFFNSGEKYCIIFEDDIKLKNGLSDVLRYIGNLPENTDMCYILRKPLNSEDEKEQQSEFIRVGKSYWTCAYILTKSGVEKLLSSKFLENIIPVDEFLAIMYDNSYLRNYAKNYRGIDDFIAYAIKNPENICSLSENAFKESATFHSNIYRNVEQNTPIGVGMIALTYSSPENSSTRRWIESCEKYDIPYEILPSETTVVEYAQNIDPKTWIVFSDSNISFFTGNPRVFKLEFTNTAVGFIKKASEISRSDIAQNELLIMTADRHGQSNPLLLCAVPKNEKTILSLNSIENYTHGKVYNSYGYSLPSSKDTLPEVLIIFFDSGRKSSDFLKTLRYPQEKLSIVCLSEKEHADVARRLVSSTCQYVWMLYPNHYIDSDSSILADLICTGKDIVSGLIVKENEIFSNFWGAIDDRGYYVRSHDYISIVRREKISCWNVPYITGNILMKRKVLERNPDVLLAKNGMDQDMAICKNLRDANELMYLLNYKLYGKYVPTGVNVDNDLTLEKCLHPKFKEFLVNNTPAGGAAGDLFKELGPDVWQFPIFTEEFCDKIVEIAEDANKWSGGTMSTEKYDKRIGAVENFPTQDVHLNQIGLDKFWREEIIAKCMRKVLHHLYKYTVKDINIAFVVKYTEGGQTKLDPHHDASVYTTNIALNSFDKDYTGSGCRFIFKNVTITENPKGYMVLHPGKLTHFHEALPLKTGTRYILVSFNN